ncbi:hypothetical protein [Agaricicola taiwanensis]|nr:hypothetical protein [Agaricicola taiwanensis]
MTEIRPLAAEDIPAIGTLFQRVFRNPKDPAPEALLDCMRELFFRHPWRDPAIQSQVYVTPERTIGGYIGVIPLRMRLKGRVLSAAAPTTIAVAEPAKNPMAGALLLRTFMNGAQDVSVSEPINPIAVGMWEKFSARAATMESMEWLALFRPAAFAASLAAERFPLTRFGRPVAGPLDRMLARYLARDPHRVTAQNQAEVQDLPRDQFIRAFIQLADEAYDLTPDWDEETLGWQLAHASGNRKRGPLQHRLVVDRNDRVIGGYIYHAHPGGVAWVIQLLSRPDTALQVVDAMLLQLDAEGYVSAKGRTQARLVEPLLKRRALMFRRHSAMVHARDPEILAAVHEGRGITSGFAGETWTRLVSDRYTP